MSIFNALQVGFLSLLVSAPAVICADDSVLPEHSLSLSADSVCQLSSCSMVRELENVLDKAGFADSSRSVDNMLIESCQQKRNTYASDPFACHEHMNFSYLFSWLQFGIPDFTSLLLITPGEASMLYGAISAVCTKFDGMKMPVVFVRHGSTQDANAFAISTFSGESIVIINAALLKQADDEMLMGLIAHELGHIFLQHSQKRIKFFGIIAVAQLAGSGYLFGQMIRDFSGGDISGKCKSVVGYMFKNAIWSQAIQQILFIQYRKHEFEADMASSMGLGSSLPMIRCIEEIFTPRQQSFYDDLEKEAEKAHTFAGRIKIVLKRLGYALAFNGFTTHPTNKARLEELQKYEKNTTAIAA